MKVILSKQLTNKISTKWNNWNWKLVLQEINHQRKSYSKKLNKYVTVFDYIDKILIVLSAASSGVSIISFTSILGAPVEIASANFTLIFSLTTGIVKKLLNIRRNNNNNKKTW